VSFVRMSSYDVLNVIAKNKFAKILIRWCIFIKLFVAARKTLAVVQSASDHLHLVWKTKCFFQYIP